MKPTKMEYVNALENIKYYEKQGKTQKMMMQFIQNCLLPESELEPLRRLFRNVDKNFDYSLTKNEFVDGLKKMGMQDA